MWSFIGYALAVLFALLMLAIVGFIIFGDIVLARRYIKANRVIGNIVKADGVSETANYGLLQPATKYFKYIVDYSVDGKIYQGVFLSKNEGLPEGLPVEVRYTVYKDGSIEIVNRDYRDRLFRLIFVVILAIPMCILIIVFLDNE